MSSKSDTEKRIREAAFRALAARGYADLSIDDIGEELGQNPAIIYHYFDSKDDLLLAMLERFVDIAVGQVADGQICDAQADIETFVANVLHPPQTEAEQVMVSPPEDIESATARVHAELWAQAMWNDDFREEMTRVQSEMRGALARIIEIGIEDGQLRPVDAAQTADHILFLVNQGLHARAATNRDDAVEQVETIIGELIADISREE
jgi:AcrR family transcriptional regulator